MHVVRMPGDGRCMYHSVAYNLKSDARLVLNRLVDFQTLFGNTRVHAHEPETQADWIFLEFGQSLEDQKRGLFRRWGGTIDLLALSRIFQRDIQVYLRNFNQKIVIAKQDVCTQTLERPILILQNGVNHQDAIEL